MNRRPRKPHLCMVDSSGQALSLGCVVVASPPALGVVRPCWGCSPRPMPIPPGGVGLAIARAQSAEAAPGFDRIGSSTITAPERTRPVLDHAFINLSAKFLPNLLSDTGRIIGLGIFVGFSRW